ncbi:MAG: N-acetylglucosamine-6-phosphate deacetylase [Bryobacteraceae bacterium]
MKCNGIHFANGEHSEISFREAIEAVDPQLGPRSGVDYLAPGFIDLQVNGFAGADYCSPKTSHDDIARSIRAIYSTGVTRFYPTVITGSPDNMSGALKNLASARRSIPEGAAIAGFHVEGPYISPEDGPRGAHPQRWVRPPDLDEFRRFQESAEDGIRLMTVSPEWPEAPKFVESLVSTGVVVSVGHTKASAQQIQDAVSAGASMSTHLGNGAHSVLPRHPNYIWDQLAEDRLAAGFIVDGIHLPDSFLRTALRAKGLQRSILVTDAVMPAGCSPGRYKLGEVDVELHADGSVRMVGGTRLAGSALRMDHAIGNVMRSADLSLLDAITLATRNPARVGRVAGRLRGLTPGDRGDVVKFRFDRETRQVQVLETYMGGERVFTAGGN